MASNICNQVWLVNIGEPIPIKGGKSFRMSCFNQHIKKMGYETVFFTTDFEHQRKKWIKELPAQYEVIKSLISYKKNVGFGRILNHVVVAFNFFLKILSREKPKIILVSYPTIMLSLVVTIYGKFKKVPVVVDVRDLWPDIFIKSKKFQWVIYPLILIKNYIFRNSSSIAVSPGYYKWANNSDEYDENKILPLSHSDFNSGVKSISNTKKIIFIFVGSLGSTYDLDLILKFHDKLILEDINFGIEVCGDGPRRDDFLSKSSTRSKINFNGWLNESDLQKILDKSHFGLMFYYADSPQGWPNKLIEYMSNGLPILNPLKGETWEIIEKSGIGYNFENINGLVDHVKSLIGNHEVYEKCSKDNINLFSSKFSASNNFSKLNKILKL